MRNFQFLLLCYENVSIFFSLVLEIGSCLNLEGSNLECLVK